ncbi:MAG: hypothetical protein IJ901_05850 [Bacteroidaceae bacterium]|nr:hypothetical protein [Bacteroidaceae bacterium]
MAKFSDCRRKVLPLRRENCAAAVGELCGGSERTVRRQSENFATTVAELCDGSQRTVPGKRRALLVRV